MNRSNDFDEHWRDLCADLNDEDGIDTHDRRRRGKRKNAEDWRAHRLCGQARRVVQMCLAECADPDLQALVVIRVQPADSPRVLLVTLRYQGIGAPVFDDLHARLSMMAGRFRSELARSIHRKRTPQLFFQIELESNDV